MLQPISLLTLASTALTIALPQDPTTGPSGGAPLYPPTTNLTFYQGVTASTGSTHQSSYTSHANDCGMYVADGTISSGVCTRFTTQGVGIWGVEGGVRCSLTLYSGSDDCGEDAEKSVVRVEGGEGEVTCVATGVLDGGVHYHGSGIWTCG